MYEGGTGATLHKQRNIYSEFVASSETILFSIFFLQKGGTTQPYTETRPAPTVNRAAATAAFQDNGKHNNNNSSETSPAPTVNRAATAAAAFQDNGKQQQQQQQQLRD